jgi:hypothetical protein
MQKVIARIAVTTTDLQLHHELDEHDVSGKNRMSNRVATPNFSAGRFKDEDAEKISGWQARDK